MKLSAWLDASIVFLVAVVGLLLSLTPTTNHGQLATDVSWPNCAAARPAATALGIVGVTGGLDFHPNTCVTAEATWFPHVALYMNTGWPGTDFHLQFPNSPKKCAPHDANCLAYNYGYHAAEYALHYANTQLVHSSTWWLDVETENSWTSDRSQNRMALSGMVAAIQRHVPRAQIGFYSFPGQWQQIVGTWRPDFPAWVATGSPARKDAIKACKAPSFTGGSVVLTQYTPKLDENYFC